MARSVPSPHNRTTPSGQTTRSDLFTALADPSRRRILTLLRHRELSLLAISREFSISRPAVIKHVRILRATGLVHVRRVGRESMHRLDPTPLGQVRDWISEFDQFWETRLDRLRKIAEERP